MTLRYAKSVKGQCDMCYNLLQLNVTGIFLLCRLTLLLSIPWTIITRSLQKVSTTLMRPSSVSIEGTWKYPCYNFM